MFFDTWMLIGFWLAAATGVSYHLVNGLISIYWRVYGLRREIRKMRDAWAAANSDAAKQQVLAAFNRFIAVELRRYVEVTFGDKLVFDGHVGTSPGLLLEQMQRLGSDPHYSDFIAAFKVRNDAIARM